MLHESGVLRALFQLDMPQTAMLPGRVWQAVGLGGLGVAGVLLAVRGMVTGRQFVPSPASRHARYMGVAATWASIPLLMLGLAFVGAAFVWGLGAETRLLAGIGAHPGPILIGVGVAVWSGARANRYGYRLTQAADSQLVRSGAPPLALMLIGAGLIGLGVFESVAPAVFDAGLAALGQFVLARLGVA